MSHFAVDFHHFTRLFEPICSLKHSRCRQKQSPREKLWFLLKKYVFPQKYPVNRFNGLHWYIKAFHAKYKNYPPSPLPQKTAPEGQSFRKRKETPPSETGPVQRQNTAAARFSTNLRGRTQMRPSPWEVAQISRFN